MACLATYPMHCSSTARKTLRRWAVPSKSGCRARRVVAVVAVVAVVVVGIVVVAIVAVVAVVVAVAVAVGDA